MKFCYRSHASGAVKPASKSTCMKPGLKIYKKTLDEFPEICSLSSSFCLIYFTTD